MVQWIIIKMKRFYIDAFSNRSYIIQLMASVNITYWCIKCSTIVLYIDRKNFTWRETVYCCHSRCIDKRTVGKRTIVKMLCIIPNSFALSKTLDICKHQHTFTNILLFSSQDLELAGWSLAEVWELTVANNVKSIFLFISP